ncbi:MAG: hypothetical protein KDA63_04445, partial [Planctomycetales bacterium]|nr:hypothetical protein [Planctomycetales bacterium]
SPATPPVARLQNPRAVRSRKRPGTSGVEISPRHCPKVLGYRNYGTSVFYDAGVNRIVSNANQLKSVYASLSDVSNRTTSLSIAGTSGTSSKQLRLDEEIQDLKKKVATQATEIVELKEGTKDKEQKIIALEVNQKELLAKIDLRHLLDRVGDPARALLLDDRGLKELFDENETCLAYVVSIDLRRSTELMLKAREPKRFAEFISSLALSLRGVILEHFGVFDKFTGDGILAYFPEFFAGASSGLLAIESAKRCHQVFDQHYREHRHCFTSVLQSTGLGIGVDYGEVSIVHMKGELTVVGTPVVYACRLGGANGGTTLVNQQAYEELLGRFSEYLDFEERSIEFKHEGPMLAYAVRRNEKTAKISSPAWLLEQDDVSLKSDELPADLQKSPTSNPSPEDGAEKY